ncbi:uncharacterized protein LOC133526164 [Cydia pomonella]|uniref:uncharacterized protein LOC133526164 n=1 Tax=Cydia pomonella TaxID=82600 RepID=UPI002ADD9E09|nr:uncharacterized protein LOC133526164 [Cydia pomonella]
MMDKENYETYEFMPAPGSSAEAEPYQFFVVQDDGTFLINRQVQYVTQVQDTQEVLEGEQACTMLDVAPQQFYVDIDTTTEMISVPDQFSIPEGTNNLYANSYLLQPETEAPVDQVKVELKPILQADNSVIETNKQDVLAGNSLTEITLTDEQYHILEQKGWILLETNEKVYVLDTLGLHDITNNEKLIQKLKTEDTAPNSISEARVTETEPGLLKIEYPPLSEMDMEKLNCAQNESKVELVEDTSDLALMVDDNIDNKDQEIEKSQWEEKPIAEKTDTRNKPVENLYSGVCDNWKDENVLRIRTDFCLKDIPYKIILGKTKNGKRLVCRVIKSDENVAKETQHSDADLDSISDSIGSSDLGDDKLDSIFRMCFTESTVKYSTEDVAFAEKVIRNLVRLPAVKPAVANRNVLVTKVVVTHEDANLIESLPTLVTGEVVSTDNKTWRFVHRPELYATAKDELSQALDNYTGVDHNFLHIHIHEIRLQDIVRTSVTLNKRRLELSSTQHSERIFIPALPLNASTDAEPENTMFGYACGTCAAIFRSESDLNTHRETHKMDTDDKLTIDTLEENYNKNGILVLSDPLNKTRTFACMQCNAKFQRLNNCQRHVKTHMAPVDSENPDAKKRVYKCKICYSFFHHAPTLLKHIMKSHIKVDK